MEESRHRISTIEECRIIDMEVHPNRMGKLAVAQSGCIPFDIRRVFYIYDIPVDARRGGHSHHSMQELIIAVSGCLDVTVDDGVNRRTYVLRNPAEGLYVPSGIWRSLDNFVSGTVCLVLASTDYDESDYVRSYPQFLSLTKGKGK